MKIPLILYAFRNAWGDETLWSKKKVSNNHEAVYTLELLWVQIVNRDKEVLAVSAVYLSGHGASDGLETPPESPEQQVWLHSINHRNNRTSEAVHSMFCYTESCPRDHFKTIHSFKKTAQKSAR